MANNLIENHDTINDPVVTPDVVEPDAAPTDNDTPADPPVDPVVDPTDQPATALPEAPGTPDADSESNDPESGNDERRRLT